MLSPFDAALVIELAAEISGTVLGPQNAGYDAARAVGGGSSAARPALIVRCATTHDVVAALSFARRVRAEVSVRSGGFPQRDVVADGGVMIDLSELKSIVVDAARATAVVGGGVVAAALDAAAAAHGLAVTGGAISALGVAPHTLGGGRGWLMARHGLAADNLLSAEVVTAEGDVLRADATSHPDLFWALRGGGGNFGIVTSLTFRLHPLDAIVGGVVAHPVAAARDLLRFYRGAVAAASDDLTVHAALLHAPGSGVKLAALLVLHAGDDETAGRELAPFLTWGAPIVADVRPMRYPTLNGILDDVLPRAVPNQRLSAFTRGLPDELIESVVQRFAVAPSHMSTLLLEHVHGAATRVAAKATAVANRDVGWNIVASASWADPAQAPASIGWARDTFAALQPPAILHGSHGENLERLREVKRRYDPDDVFHLDDDIAP